MFKMNEKSTIKSLMAINPSVKVICDAGRMARAQAVLTIIPATADITCREVIGMIVKAAAEEHKPESEVVVFYNDGMLTIGNHCRRVMASRYTYDAGAYAAEGRILARQEAYGLYD